MTGVAHSPFPQSVKTGETGIRRHDVGLSVSREGRLLIDGCDSVALAEKFGAPLWVISSKTVRRNLETIRTAMVKRHPRFRTVYASKANPNPAILKLVAEQGAIVDAVTAGHVALAIAAGIEPSQIVLNGNAKTVAELEWAVGAGVAMLNVDSVEEMETLAAVVAERPGSRVRVCFRLATDLAEHAGDPGMLESELESKFGMTSDDALRAARIAVETDGIELVGLHHHLGFTAYDSSYDAELDLRRRRRCVQQVVKVAASLKLHFDVDCNVLNFGGGFRVETDAGYGPHRVTSIPSIDSVAEVVTTYALALLAERGLSEPEIWVEPGGYVVSNAAVFLARVRLRKPGERTWLFLENTSAYHFVRRLMFDVHHSTLAAARMLDLCDDVVEVAGVTCAPDTVTRAAELPRMGPGELVAILDQGAYCEAVSTEYCAVPLPATVMVEDGVATLVRSRRTVESLVAEYVAGVDSSTASE